MPQIRRRSRLAGGVRVIGVGALVLLLAVLLVACADPVADNELPDPVPTVEWPPVETPAGLGDDDVLVEIRTATFVPQEITVTVGITVVWVNNDSFPHTVTSGEPEAPTGQFDAELITGERFAYIFEEPGIYPYHCTIHPELEGTVIVQPTPQD